MEEYPIYAFRTRVGTMTRQPVGLYDDWTAQLPGQSGLLRVYLVGEVQSALLGTPAPADDGCAAAGSWPGPASRRGSPARLAAARNGAAWQQDGGTAVAYRGRLRGGGDARAATRARRWRIFPAYSRRRSTGAFGGCGSGPWQSFTPGGSPVDCAVPLPAAPPELPEDPEIAEMPEMPGE